MEHMSRKIRFSVIVVSLNPDEKLNQTLNSILNQTYDDYEIIIKDGGSSDGSVERIPQDAHIRLFTEKDTGIYDAMNQAVAHAAGDFLLFLNCGDIFHHDTVLEETAYIIEKEQKKEKLVLYGDTYSTKNHVLITSAPEITGFTCYRNIPCHQSCFYSAELCKEKPYHVEYRIRADYDHFLWCYYAAGAKMIYMKLIVSAYEGGGYSESKENRKRDKEEYRQITSAYMGKGELLRYRMIMLLSLAPLRRFLAENKLFSKAYHKVKECMYRR